MKQNIKIGSDTELIFRIRELGTGNRTKIQQEASDYWDYPLKGIRIYLTSPEKKIISQFAVDILANEVEEEVDGYNPITVENWDDGIISIKVDKKDNTSYPVGSYFAVMDLLLDTPADVFSGTMKYTINDYPLYLGEIIDDES